MNDSSLHHIRNLCRSGAHGNTIAGSRHQLDDQHEFESVVRGLRIALLLIFVPAVVFGALIFLVAALFPTQSPTATVLVPNDFWRNFLSVTVRIGLVPGVVVLIYRITRRRRSLQSSRSLAIFLSVLLISAFAVVPFQHQPQPVVTAFSWGPRLVEPGGPESKPTRVRADSEKVQKKQALDLSNLPTRPALYKDKENISQPSVVPQHA